MLGKSITLFKLLGFEVRMDVSWFILALLIVWSLAQGLFPVYFKNLSALTYWWMGIAGALGLLVSIVFHELCHSLVAKRYGLSMKGITLFIFGGVAEMEDEPPSAKVEFFMAIAGPVSSILIGVVFYGIWMVGKGGGWPQPIYGVFGYLAFLNCILAGFNLLPAFPLDGGRVLRSLLWSWKANLRWATRIASQIGSMCAVGLIILGVLNLFSRNVIGGIWFFVIGMFLWSASRMSYKQLMIRKALEGEHVKRFMEPNPVTVAPSITVHELVEDYIYKHHFKMFPVVEDGKLIGCITTRQASDIPREEWSMRTVGELTGQCSSENTVPPEADAIKAIAMMNRTGNSRLMVVENNRLLGIIALKDMLEFLSLKLDLEKDEE
jgi:Zn-dependent protease/CBS domain-containing protein